MDNIGQGQYSIQKLKSLKSISCQGDDGLSQERLSTGLSSQSMSFVDTSSHEISLDLFKSVPRNKSTSKLMQQVISKAQPDELNKIISLLLPNLSTLMVDIYGNYICQTLFHNCSANHRLEILSQLRPSLVEISFNPRGTHALQNLIAMMNLREEEEIYQSAFKGKIVEMSKDLNSSHVVQRLLVTVNNRYFVTREIKGHVEELALDKLGVCVVKKSCNDPAIMSEVLGSALLLMQHPYGNYALQTVLDLWGEEASHEFICAMQGRVSQLCLQKFSSNVMEKALKVENIRRCLIGELLSNGKIQELLSSQYGSYVIRTASIFCDADMKLDLLKVVKEGCDNLFNAKLKPLWTEIILNLSNSSPY
jgi:hypothetical protein